MYITMGTAVYGYISYEFLGLYLEMGHTEIPTDYALLHFFKKTYKYTDCA
eukprot:COSAG02_NODE_13961_length_1326_cov_41.504482_3_plen_50_part_00